MHTPKTGAAIQIVNPDLSDRSGKTRRSQIMLGELRPSSLIVRGCISGYDGPLKDRPRLTVTFSATRKTKVFAAQVGHYIFYVFVCEPLTRWAQETPINRDRLVCDCDRPSADKFEVAVSHRRGRTSFRFAPFKSLLRDALCESGGYEGNGSGITPLLGTPILQFD